MPPKKAPAGPERVHSKSFNGAARGTVLRRWTAPTPDRFFGADFALVAFDHHPEPVWASAQWLKKPTKADLYEQWRRAPRAAVDALVAAPAEDVLRACARIAGGQLTHHDGAARWVGLVRELPLAEGTAVLLGLLERLVDDRSVAAFDEPAAFDGSEYNKTDFRYGPRVRGGDVTATLRAALPRYWRYALADAPATVAEALPEDLRARAEARFGGTRLDGHEVLHARMTAPPLAFAFAGTSREFNARVGLDTEFAMVNGTGY